MSNICIKASLKGVVQKKKGGGFRLCQTGSRVSVQTISEQHLHGDYFQSQLSQVIIKVNFWAWLHSAVCSGSSLVGYLSVSLICLRRAVEFRRCVVTSRPKFLTLSNTKATLDRSVPLAQPTEQDPHVTDYIIHCFTFSGHIFQQEPLDHWILSSSFKEKSQALFFLCS